ncbi:hypothetical protein JD969_20545 [Planctomycetota bacterium]|nr:hypothetical protein JD969_20545 [Planctomycetota bacterium]
MKKTSNYYQNEHNKLERMEIRMTIRCIITFTCLTSLASCASTQSSTIGPYDTPAQNAKFNQQVQQEYTLKRREYEQRTDPQLQPRYQFFQNGIKYSSPQKPFISYEDYYKQQYNKIKQTQSEE